jgi:hypothetical protein
MRKVLREVCCEARRKKLTKPSKIHKNIIFDKIENGESLANIVKDFKIHTMTKIKAFKNIFCLFYFLFVFLLIPFWNSFLF